MKKLIQILICGYFHIIYSFLLLCCIYYTEICLICYITTPKLIFFCNTPGL